jgi:hypothetical protein
MTIPESAALTPARSNRRVVRNPLLALPAYKRLDALPEDSRAALRALLLELRTDARMRADKCWKTSKGPMALYWKCVAVYTGHIAKLLAPAR